MRANSYRQIWNYRCNKEAENVGSLNFYKGWQDREERAVDKGRSLKEEPFKQRLPEDKNRQKADF